MRWIVCAVCGCPVQATSGVKKYCEPCADEARKSYISAYQKTDLRKAYMAAYQAAYRKPHASKALDAAREETDKYKNRRAEYRKTDARKNTVTKFRRKQASARNLIIATQAMEPTNDQQP